MKINCNNYFCEPNQIIMSYLTLTNYFEVVNNVAYNLSLRGKMETNNKYWRFIVDVTYSLDGNEISSSFSFRDFDELRRCLIDGTNRIPTDGIVFHKLSDGSVIIRYRSKEYTWSVDLVEIIKESKYHDAFIKFLTKCNGTYYSQQGRKINGWKDVEKIPDSVENMRKYSWLCTKYVMRNSDVYSIDLFAQTSEELDRWYPKIHLHLCKRDKSETQEYLHLNVIDFLMLRDFLIQFVKTGYYNELYLSDNGKAEVSSETEGDKVIKLVIILGGEKFTFDIDFINFIVKGLFIQRMENMLCKLNYKMEPQSYFKYWFFRGVVIVDEGVIRNSSHE
jgi:hypothetical protein